MKTTIWTKVCVLSIILLFVGTSVVPTFAGTSSLATSHSGGSVKIMQTKASAFTGSTYSSQASWLPTNEAAATQLASTDLYRQTSGQRGTLSDNANITLPLNNDIFRPGDSIAIEGTANGTGFAFFTVEWGLGEYPSTWSTAGITLVGGGSSPIVYGSLAAWDTTGVAAGYYSIRLTVNFTTTEEQTIVTDLYIDPTLKAGWPQRVPYEYNAQQGYYDWAGFLEPAVADINNDGNCEIVIYKGGNPPKLDVYTADGAILWEASVGDTEAAGGNLHIPILGDINNDGFLEIVVFRYMVTQSSEIYVYDHTGSILPGWPITLPKEYHPTLLIADVNNDGYGEIIYQGNSANTRIMAVISHDGTIISQWDLWNVGWGASVEPCPAVGNFDSDPDLEIVSVGPSENAGYNFTSGEWVNEGRIQVYNIDGSTVPGWPIYTEGVIFGSPVTGDIDHNGYDDIVIGLMFAGNAPDDRYGGLWAFDYQGNALPGFPYEKGWNFQSAPALADIDHDGYLEIVASRLGFVTYVVRYDGSTQTGWPQYTTWNDYYSAVVGDINGDGALDIITTAGNGFYPSIYNPGGVYAWNADGTKIDGFPKVTDSDAQAPATIADIDQDGKVEVIASSDWDYDFHTTIGKNRGTLYVWDVDSAYNQSTMEWPTFHRDIERTGMYPFTFEPKPQFAIENITGGLFKIKTSIKNTGLVPATNITWNITLTGGLILSGRQTTGSIATLDVNGTQDISSKAILGFGKTVITVSASIDGFNATRDQNATVRLFFIRMK